MHALISLTFNQGTVNWDIPDVMAQIVLPSSILTIAFQRMNRYGKWSGSAAEVHNVSHALTTEHHVWPK
jgi:hypothetical protein